MAMHALLPQPETFSNSRMPCWSLRLSQIHARGPGKMGSTLCFSKPFSKHHCHLPRAVGDSTPGLPFRVAGTQGERLPMLEPEHLARRRRRVPAPTLGTVSPTALAHCSHADKQIVIPGRGPAPHSGHSLFSIFRRARAHHPSRGIDWHSEHHPACTAAPPELG